MPKAEKLISYSSNLQDAILHVVLYRIVDYIPLLQPSGLQKISIQYTPRIYCFTRKAEIYDFKTGPHLPSCYVYMLLVLFSRPLRKLNKTPPQSLYFNQHYIQAIYRELGPVLSRMHVAKKNMHTYPRVLNMYT